MEAFVEEVRSAIAEDERRLSALRLARSLDLPDGAIAGAFVRCAVWDRLHEHKGPTLPFAIDVVYFDPDRVDPRVDESIESELVALAPRRPWTVRNLARLRPEAQSLAGGLTVFLDTASAVAVRLDARDEVEVVAPFGLEDLVGGIVRPTRPEAIDAVRQRVAEQRWLVRYPKLVLS